MDGWRGVCGRGRSPSRWIWGNVLNFCWRRWDGLRSGFMLHVLHASFGPLFPLHLTAWPEFLILSWGSLRLPPSFPCWCQLIFVGQQKDHSCLHGIHCLGNYKEHSLLCTPRTFFRGFIIFGILLNPALTPSGFLDGDVFSICTAPEFTTMVDQPGLPRSNNYKSSPYISNQKKRKVLSHEIERWLRGEDGWKNQNKTN